MPITLTDSMEDYLEAVLIIKLQRKEVRVSDIADLLNVSRPSVVSALSALEKRQLITHAPYSDVKLTELGARKAKEIYSQKCWGSRPTSLSRTPAEWSTPCTWRPSNGCPNTSNS